MTWIICYLVWKKSSQNTHRYIQVYFVSWSQTKITSGTMSSAARGGSKRGHRSGTQVWRGLQVLNSGRYRKSKTKAKHSYLRNKLETILCCRLSSGFRSICFTDWSQNLFYFSISSLGLKYWKLAVNLLLWDSSLLLHYRTLIVASPFAFWVLRFPSSLSVFMASSFSELCNIILQLIHLVVYIISFFPLIFYLFSIRTRLGS